MRFKFDSHHIQIMQAGLELGLRNLSPAELADCYDEMCNCGKLHDPENIKRLRTRVVKIMDRLAKNLPAKQST
jgi:membrane carboxypeptidase/penicillin-binding protein